ncbi:UNVERIFIED_CONTAM: fabD [Trichonephila clavipes]
MSTKRLEQAAQATKTAFVFPGQGSQKVGMLAELAEQFSVVQETFAEASEALGFDLWHIAQSGEGLDQTENTQPVLLTASIALWRVWLELGGVAPKYLAGHSLGEYSALVAAEAMTLADAVKLVNLRGKLMQSAVPKGEGAMAAILGLADEKVIELCQKASATGQGSVEAANYNAQGQVVIAGSAALVQQVMAEAKEQSGKAIALPVSVPSHCTLMKPAAEKFAEALEQTAIELPHLPVIQNVNAEIATDVAQLRQALTAQLYESVQWTKTMQYLQDQGIQYVVECGPGTVLSNLAKRLPNIEKAFAIDSKARMEDALNAVRKNCMTQQRKVALVTGASRGIGAAIAQQLIQDGFFVVGTATSESGAQKLTESFAENGAGAVLDVRDGEAIDALVSDIEQKYGSVLVLVNNAGITKDNLLLRMSEDDWDDILNIHLKAVYRLSKRVLKGMTKARFGRIINISSVVAHFANPGQANYSAAKAGIEAFSRSLAKEMGSRQITVNSVAPGFIATEMTDQLSEEIRKKMTDQVALNRLGEPQDIADAVSFLASDKASYITGTVLHWQIKTPQAMRRIPVSDIEQRIKQAVAEQLGMRAEEIKNEASFMDDLGADSLDLVELVMSFENDFDITIPDEDSNEITTVQSAIDYVTKKLG